MTLKILYWLGIAACLLLVIACFLPWCYYADANIVTDAERTFTGFYSYKNSYGKPGKFLTAISIIALLLMLLPRIWAKRVNLFVCALGVGYAIKEYVLYTSCYNAYCPEKKAGIFLMLAATIIMLIASVFPDLQLNKIDKSESVQ